MGYRRQRPGCKEERARHRRQRNKARKAAVRSTGRQRPCTRRCGRGIGDSGTKHGRQQSEAQEGNARVQGGTSGTKHGRQRPEAQGKSGQGTAVSNQNERIQTVHGPTRSGQLIRSKAPQPTRSQQPLRTASGSNEGKERRGRKYSPAMCPTSRFIFLFL